ncbi:2-dehydro-3-deoxygalactonokinase [Brevundimonas sp. SORGH_AS_0993]|uniref:2-dehydro-3-deoxygalactonokinase n=1 Tax=Brevundimonas sp. SORGH_AS_0993 TaxID=3041794 RepID=UPI0027898CD1|nr:2-dehydro-3-deoxygalactonokinase [Brevundimonas sp. SORGH_AS_0993]MDQ1155624.1 2-dehydro-3-deoxygalactonokinase [Brevundimonas sp. SORGH_AS_0993]
MNGQARLIGVDWGTSNLRVMRIAAGGAVLDSRSDPRGAGGLTPDQFRPVLEQVAGDWLNQGLPVLVSGMAGARGKWREMAYLPCPAGVPDLATAVASPDDAPYVVIVPGVALFEDGRLKDVMRGEETQVVSLDVSQDAVVVGPGTHSKWIRTADGRIMDFRTFMTGELFAAIRQGTILGADMGEPGADDAAFAAGVDRALHDTAITAALFSVRVEGLAGRLSPAWAADYLSGLLIGAEVVAQIDAKDRPVILIGAPALCRRYADALKQGGFHDVRTADSAVATAGGLWRIHEALRR